MVINGNRNGSKDFMTHTKIAYNFKTQEENAFKLANMQGNHVQGVS